MLNFIDVKVGQKLTLRDGRIAEVIDNIGDGIWLHVRFADVDEVEDDTLLHCEDVLGLAESG